MANGEIFLWLNSDDILMDGSLIGIAKAFNSVSNKKRFIGLGRRVNIDNKSLVTGIKPFSLGMANVQAIAWGVSRGPHQEATCWSKSIWDNHGPLDYEFEYAFDLDFFLKVFSSKNNSELIPELVGAWRLWESNKCTKNEWEMKQEILLVKKKHRNENSVFKYKYIKKIARKLVKKSQTTFAMINGLPKQGENIFTGQKSNQNFIPYIWNKILSKAI